TCGRQDDHTHASCKTNGEPYLEPNTTNVILRIDGVPAGQCNWSVDGVALPHAVDCNEKDKPATVSVAYDKPHQIKVVTPGGTFTKSMVVRDILIVSFGDSFSAGEGNPERPVKFSNVFFDYEGSSNDGGFPPKLDNFPVREPLVDHGPPPSSKFWDDFA